MSDPTQSSAPNAQNGQQELSFEERRDLQVLSIFAARDMVVDGSVDQNAVADEVEPTVLAATADVEADRSKKGVSPSKLMALHFKEVPKRSDVESDDPEVLDMIDAVYGKVKAEVFRVLNIMPDGPIQSRLATNGDGLVLCRMKGKRGAEEVAYVTRNRKLINADNLTPAYHRVDLALARAAALTGMSVERVPEHGMWFHRQHKRAINLSVDKGNDVVMAALDAGDQPADGPAEDGDE
jgi:hypothetical protein